MFHLTEDGRLINKSAQTSRRIGDFADKHDRRGYRSLFVDGKLQFAHRVIWKMAHGKDPIGYLDHINGDILDNRPENLREASHSQNMFNRKRSLHNTSGVKGICFRKDTGVWRAYISHEGKRLNLGQFNKIEDAEVVLNKAREKLHGKFARVA